MGKSSTADVWSRGLDNDKERGRATAENRNENAAVDMLCYNGYL